MRHVFPRGGTPIFFSQAEKQLDVVLDFAGDQEILFHMIVAVFSQTACHLGMG